MPLTKEELLKPRRKVIADMPFNHFSVGDIVSDVDKIEGYQFSKYPHLFKQLKWHEDRDWKDLPKYVKWGIKFKHVFKVNGYGTGGNTGRIHALYNWNGALRSKPVQCLLPATEEEYLNQPNKKGKEELV